MFKRILGLSKEQRKQHSSFQDKKQLSSSKLWLDENYPKKLRSQINSLEISGKDLDGLLNLVDFTNLEELYCYDNQLTGIKFANNSFDKLRVLHVGNNSFSEQDLDLFSHLRSLEVLNLGSNNFRGDLRVLKDLVNLRSLDISDTNIDSGLIYLSEKLESLFCQVEKDSECQRIKEMLKDYDLGNDCYDFQSWWKDENWLVIPGSWPKDKFDKELESLAREKVFNKKKKLFRLVNDIYQALVLNESEEKNIVPLFEVEKDIDEFWKIAKEMKKEKEVFAFDDLKEQFEFDSRNLVLVAEKYLSDNKKIKILEERIRELKQSNDLLAEKNEFWKLLQLELTKQKDRVCANCWKSEEQEIVTTDEFKKLEKVKSNDDRKKTYKYKNKKNTNNIMTNNTNNINNKKIFILEWESKELKDRMPYENFKVIVGSEKGNLLFYSTFFVDVDEIKFKKKEIYQLSTSGNFDEDTSGTIPGSFDASGIIQGIDSGGYEFERVFPSLMIKELWEGKEEKTEKLDLAEKDLEKKKKDNTKINQELLEVRKELSNLQRKFSNLQLEKDESDKKLNTAEENLEKEQAINEKNEQKLDNYQAEAKQLQDRFDNLQSEKGKIENEWTSPESKKQLLQEKENLSHQLKKARREIQKLTELLEEMRSQGLKDNIQKRSEEKKKEQEMLKLVAENKLGNQAYLLENLLEKLEDFYLVVFDENFSQTSKLFLRAQEKLQDAKDKLIVKLSPEEIEEICQVQTEISKLEVQQNKWEETGDKDKQTKEEQFETFMETPPATPRG